AVTRARQELVVYASFLSDQLRAERSSARGVHDVKAFLEYAEKGPTAIFAQSEGSLGGHESPLEEAIAAALQDRGWQIDPQVGVSGFRIDLGIVHPDKPGAYLAAVECDGATYHRSAVARDRDKTRQQILENLGWTIIRAWSTDWWYDPESALAQIDGALTELLQRSREEPQQSSGESPVPPSGEVSRGAAPDQNELPDEPNALDTPPPRDPPSALAAPHQAEPATGAAPPQLVGRQAAQQNCCYYSLIDLGDASAHQSRFFDDD